MARVFGRPGSVVAAEALGQDPALLEPWEVEFPRFKSRKKSGSLLEELLGLASSVVEVGVWMVSGIVIQGMRLLDRREHSASESSMLRAGAHGETRVAEELERLSDDYWVLHDVRLVASQPMRYDGVGLRTAQVDHLVVGPTGVFVIEAKCWGRDHAAEGYAFSPFQQVRRAGYLCYRLLKDGVGETKVRQVVVPVGAPLKPIDGHHVDLVWPSRLVEHIRGGRESLEKDRVERVAGFLAGRVATPGT